MEGMVKMVVLCFSFGGFFYIIKKERLEWEEIILNIESKIQTCMVHIQILIQNINDE
jgi:hypothetical protein